eukprot:GHVU01167293.1.p1 GENE.GHVU01167293.1~~GHVU01167293.1.p1  ORF type:complete len:596 (-),score=108.28 GHVU01167293.1:878-2665(-)
MYRTVAHNAGAADDPVISDFGQLNVEKMCCLYFAIDVRSPSDFDSLKALLLTASILGYDTDYRVSAHSGSTPVAHPSPLLRQRGKFRRLVAQLVFGTPELPFRTVATVCAHLRDSEGFNTYRSLHEAMPTYDDGGSSPPIRHSVQLLIELVDTSAGLDAGEVHDLRARLQRLLDHSADAELVLRPDIPMTTPSQKRLVVFGLNRILIAEDSFHELLAAIGFDFASLASAPGTPGSPVRLAHHIAALKGHQHEAVLAKAEQRLRLTRGARVVCAALKMMGYKLALVSNGIGDIARVVGKELNFDYVLSNQLAVSEDGKMTGKLCGEGAAMRAEHLLDPWRKLDWLKLLQDKEGIAGADIVYIGGAEGGGGGATEGGGGVGEEGVSLSFLRGNCCYHIPFDVRRHGDLRSVLYLMGLSGNDVHEFVDVVRAQRRDMTVESEPLREPMYPWGDAKQLVEPQQGGDRRRRRSAGASLPSPPPSHRPQRSANASSPGLHGGLANALEIVREEVAEGEGGKGDNERGGEAADVIVATAAAAGSTASHGLSAECNERSPPDARAGRHKLTTDSIMAAPPKAAVVTKAIVHVYGSYRSGAFSR